MDKPDVHEGLVLGPNLSDPDEFYTALMDAIRGLDDAAAERVNTRLILLLANQIGDVAVLKEAIAIARDSHSA